ncbi:MAG: ATP-binding protein [Thermoleophilaceae bacterium]
MSSAAEFCPRGLCDGSGFILEEGNVARPCPCREVRINRATSRRMGTGIPRRFRGVSFDRRPVCDLDPVVLRDVQGFVRNIDDNLAAGRGRWFYGDVGTGKTSLAMLISQAALESGHSVAIYSVPRLLAEIKATYEDGSGPSYQQLFRQLCEVELLHLDDVGAEKRTDWVLEQLYSIVNERWQDERSILVTTNLLDLDELREQVGARTVSRLTEVCGEAIPIMGADLRMAFSGVNAPSAEPLGNGLAPAPPRAAGSRAS